MACRPSCTACERRMVVFRFPDRPSTSTDVGRREGNRLLHGRSPSIGDDGARRFRWLWPANSGTATFTATAIVGAASGRCPVPHVPRRIDFQDARRRALDFNWPASLLGRFVAAMPVGECRTAAARTAVKPTPEKSVSTTVGWTLSTGKPEHFPACIDDSKYAWPADMVDPPPR